MASIYFAAPDVRAQCLPFWHFPAPALQPHMWLFVVSTLLQVCRQCAGMPWALLCINRVGAGLCE